MRGMSEKTGLSGRITPMTAPLGYRRCPQPQVLTSRLRLSPAAISGACKHLRALAKEIDVSQLWDGLLPRLPCEAGEIRLDLGVNLCDQVTRIFP